MKKLGLILIVALFTTVAFAAELTEPILLTSIGQSADLSMAKAMLKKAGCDSAKLVVDKLATAAKVPEGGTVAMVVGASNKGLGEARISVDTEIARAKTLIEAAKKAKAKILLIHVGGKERRGGQSEAICKAVADAADVLVVKKDGDTDSFFANIAKANKKPYHGFVKIPEGTKELATAFGKK